MSEVHILGHCNSTLAILIDALGVSGEAIRHVKVVSNVPVDDDTPWQPHPSFGFEVEELSQEQWDGAFRRLLIGVYKPETKRVVCDAFGRSHGIRHSDFSRVVHPAAIVSPGATLGFGVFLAPGTIVAPFAALGDFVTVNRNSSIGHHTRVGSFTSINPGCQVAGKCRIGANVTVGIGAIILDGLSIGDNAVIAAGSVVTRSLPGDVVAMGTPAKVVRQREELR